jgi:uncharacterized protein (DUF2141 family)
MKLFYKSVLTGLLSAMLLLITQPSIAQWASNTATNTAVSTIVMNHANMHQSVSDGAGGTFVVWRDNRNSATSDFDIYAQYFNASGVAQWTADGIPVCTATGLQTYPYVITDGNGGIVVGWLDKRNGSDFDIYAQKLNAAGTVQWTANGVAISTATRGQGSLYGYGGEHGFDMTTDGAGGAILAWMDLRDNADSHHCSVYTQRVNSAGTVQWTANGVAIYVATGYTNYPPNYVEILTDGANGAFIVWSDNRSGDTENQNLYIQRVNSSGVAQWTANGITVCDAANNQYGYGKSIVSDGANGLIVTWSDIRSNTWQIYAQRFNSSGVAQWTANGVAITNYTSNTNPRQYNRVVTDGANGAIISWDDNRTGSWDIYAQRINASGAVQWTANGVVISNAINNQTFNQMVTDGNNGAIITWTDERSGAHIYAQRINNAGAVQWTANGAVVANATAQAGQSNPMITVANSGGAVVVFEDDRQNIYYRSLWIQKINADGSSTVLSSNADLSALTISSGTLSPSFGSSTTAYTASVGNVVSSVTITPTRSDANATIQAQVNSGGYSAVTSGSPSGSLSLSVGANTINVKVTAQDGSTIKTYTITVTRAAAPVPPTITSFTPTSGAAGTSVTITGTNFNTTAANDIVYFGATKATVVGTPTATSITVTVPAGASFAPITLVNTAFNLSAKSNMRFNPTFTAGKTTIASADFDAAVTTALSDPAFSYQVVTGDLDGDGKPEVVAAGRNSSSVIVLRNTSTSGTVSFGTRYDIPSAYQEQFAVELADMDGDGKLDIVANGGNLNGFGISVLRNTSSGTGSFTFATATGVVTNSTGLTITTGDVDADGKPDIIAADGDKIVVYRNTSSVGSLSFTNAYNTGSGTQSNYVSCRPSIADIDGDGKLDIVSANDTNMEIFLNTSSGTGNINFGTASTFAAAYSVMKTAIGDFDGDGKLDVATSGNYGAATTVLGIFRNTTSGGTPSFTRTDYTTTDPGDLSIADFNGDGKADIAVSNLTLHGSYQPVSVFQNKSSSGSITFSSKIDVGVSGAFSPYYSTSNDLDGDGKPDIITSNGNSIAVFHNNSLVPVWTGATSSAWTTASNWSPASVPASGAEVSIPSGTPNSPNISSPITVGDLNIAAGGTFTANADLQVTGIFTNNGTIAGTGAVVLNGSSAQTITGTGTINNLTLNNSTGVTITSGKTSIAGTLTLTSGVLTTGGLLSLKSDASSTGRIGTITGGSISGNLTQERYIATKTVRGYSFVASPFVQTIASSWQQQVHITGAGTGGTVCPSLTAHTNGFDATVSNAASMFIYDGTKAAGSRWTSVTGTTAVSLTPGTGYRMNIRGPRSIGCSLLDGTVTAVTTATLNSTGTLSNANKNMGSFNLSLLNNGNATVSNDNYLFVGNPYPSQISFASLLAANNGGSGINNTYATYGPDNLVGNYAFWNGATWTGASTGLSNSTGDIIANGQAFFVQAKVAGAGVTLAFTESMKTGSANNGYFRQINPNRLRIGYLLANGNKADEIMLEFANNNSSTVLNDGDVVSMNTGSQNLKSIKAGRELAFNARNINFLSDTVKLNVVSTANGTFKLSFYDFDEMVQSSQTKIWLLDSYTGTAQLMNDNKEYAFTVNTAIAATQGADRFSVIFSKPAPITLIPVVGIKAYPNPVMDQLTVEIPSNESFTIQLVDIYGRIVLQAKASGTVNLKTSKLPAGSYMLETSNAKGERTVQKIIKQ